MKLTKTENVKVFKVTDISGVWEYTEDFVAAKDKRSAYEYILNDLAWSDVGTLGLDFEIKEIRNKKQLDNARYKSLQKEYQNYNLPISF